MIIEGFSAFPEGPGSLLLRNQGLKTRSIMVFWALIPQEL